MDVRHSGLRGFLSILPAVLLAVMMAGCEDGQDGVDGATGPTGPTGPSGTDGTNGISCWDLNQNGVADLPDEDINKDGKVDVEDCRAPNGAYDPAGLHKGYFTENPYEGTKDCLYCHGKVGDDVMTTAHWKWQGEPTGIPAALGTGEHGKNDIINNFCIAVPSNEGRCTQCHIGYGYADKNFFPQATSKDIDCLACHDQTGTYKKAQTTAGLPEPSVDLQAVAKSVGEAGGVPTRTACLFCHKDAGGGDNIKHGDLSSDLVATTTEYDVHMGVTRPDGSAGPGMSCVRCHDVKRDAENKASSHGIGGMVYHSTDEGAMKTCTDCHGSAAGIHAGTSAQSMVENHQVLACQVCHIPAIARKVSTKVEWYWSDAGQDISPIPVDPATGRPTYDKKKGTFVWANNVRPVLRYYDHQWDKAIIGQNDTFAKPAVVDGRISLAAPTATRNTPGAMIYPFKRMIGDQAVAYSVATDSYKLVVPHLFGLKGGPNPYWSFYNWDLALQDGALYTGQLYTPGTVAFADTEMMLSVNHEVAPKEMALGYQNGCDDCHFSGQVEWEALGCSADPAQVAGACPDPVN